MTFEQWAPRFSEGVTPALAVLHQCEEACARQWAPVLVADADQLRAASEALGLWIDENPCPVADLSLKLSQMARSYANAADVVEQSIDSGPSWPAIIREIQALHHVVAGVVRHYQALVAGQEGETRQTRLPPS
jgi:hypothetical protein